MGLWLGWLDGRTTLVVEYLFLLVFLPTGGYLYVSFAFQFKWELTKKAHQVFILHFALKKRAFIEEIHEKQEQVSNVVYIDFWLIALYMNGFCAFIILFFGHIISI